jgi:ribosomal protein S18 acetylase RimI-like enzyme
MLAWYLDDPRGLMFHIEQQNQIIGYCGAIKTKLPGLEGSSTSIAQYSFKAMLLALALKPWLIFHEENLKRIPLIKKNILLKLGLKQKNKLSVQSNEDFVPFWGLVVIGVDPAFQGKGIGSLLLQEFEKLAKEDGVTKINLSVKKENSKAIKSYERNGWKILSSNLDSLTMYKNI